jgi:aminoglycoside phosphotransferase (APT) family kinase protein
MSRMHEDEVAIDDALARRLVDEQLPHLAALPLRRLPPVGTDNQLFRLGEDLAVRFPRIGWAAAAPELEARWLPELAPHLPLDVPAPVALGEPAHGYPWSWTVVPWLPGRAPRREHLGATCDGVPWEDVARGLGELLVALRRIDATDAPPKPPGQRGSDLATADEWLREWTERAGDRVDQEAVLAAWEESLAAPVWDGPPVWVHCDLHAGNVLVRDGRLSAVIDWGLLGAGDPAIELNAAWSFLPPEVVPAYRDAVGLDDAAWLRGRGWALQPAISGLVYYEETAPAMSAASLRTVERVVADVRR